MKINAENNIKFEEISNNNEITLIEKNNEGNKNETNINEIENSNKS